MSIRSQIDDNLHGRMMDPRDRGPFGILLFLLLTFALVIAFCGYAFADTGSTENIRASVVTSKVHATAWKHTRKAVKRTQVADVQIVGGRPAECRITVDGKLIPFCGCALSVKIFGRVINEPNLKLASTWRHAFPKTQAAPGMVGARNGHALQLISHIEGDRWIVWDPNSGGGLIRIHERRIGRFTIVNPQASRFAMGIAQ